MKKRAGKFIISEHMNVSRWVLPGMMMRFAWQIAVDFARKLPTSFAS